MNLIEKMLAAGSIPLYDKKNNLYPKIHPVKKWVRWETSVPKHYPTFTYCMDRKITMIDDNLREPLSAIGINPVHDKERIYTLFQTTKEKTSDVGIITQFDIEELSSFDEIFINIHHLIGGSMQNEGLLHEISQAGQENINIGYCLLKNADGKRVPHVVWLERKLNEKGELLEHHIHSEAIPRLYKVNRYMLLK